MLHNYGTFEIDNNNELNGVNKHSTLSYIDNVIVMETI